MKKLIYLALSVLMVSNTFAQNKVVTSKEKQLHNRLHNKSYLNNKPLNTRGYQKTLSGTTLLDSSRYWQWDTTAKIWQLTGRSINFTYDAQNRNTSNLGQHFNGVTWVNSILNTITYGTNTKNVFAQTWDAVNNVWVNSMQHVYIYDANNNLTLDSEQVWSNNTWVNANKSIYAYNTGNKQTLGWVQAWSNNAWANDTREFWHCNANNIETDNSRVDWIYNLNSIIDSIININTINGNNDIANSLELSWNFNSHQFDTSGLFTYIYDASHNQINGLTQSYSFSTWENSIKSTSTYDANNNKTSDLVYYWQNNTWVHNYRRYDTYDGNNNNISDMNEQWNGSTWIGDSTYNYYGNISGIKRVTDNSDLIHVYPNPNNGVFRIDAGAQQIQNIYIYDMQGKLVLSPTTRSITNLDASMLSEGIYTVCLAGNESIVYKKLIIVR